jgi:HK97 gp10 family phage protein
LITSKLVGLEETQRAIRGLGEFASHEVMLAAIKPSAEEIAETMRVLIPRQTGLTAEDIKVRESSDSKSGGKVELQIGGGKGSRGRAFIMRFIEFGTFNQPARPFMRPAWDSARGHFIADVTARLRPAFEKVVRKYAKRAA